MLAVGDCWSLLSITAVPLLQLMALVLAGTLLYRFGVLSDTTVDLLVRLVITLTLPCLIVSKIVSQFRPYQPQFAHWYLLPAAAVAMVSLTALVATVVARWIVPFEYRRAFRVLCAFHNAGYLNIPIIAALYATESVNGQSADQMLVVLFLFILGISPMMWTLGVRWLRSPQTALAKDRRWRIKQIISPPFVANVLGVILCLLDVPTRIAPARLEQILAPVTWVGQCTIPLIMLSLGGILAGLRGGQRPPIGSILAAAVLRFVVIPLTGLAVLGWLLGHHLLPKSYAVILFLQTMMPTATGMAVAARRYGTSQTSQYVGRVVFILYLACLVAIPFWLMVWAAVHGFAIR